MKRQCKLVLWEFRWFGVSESTRFPCHLCSQVASLLPECSRQLRERVSPGLAIQMCCFREIIKGSSNIDLRWLRREPGFCVFNVFQMSLAGLQVGRWLCSFPRSIFFWASRFCLFFFLHGPGCFAHNLDDDTSTLVHFLKTVEVLFPRSERRSGSYICGPSSI